LRKQHKNYEEKRGTYSYENITYNKLCQEDGEGEKGRGKGALLEIFLSRGKYLCKKAEHCPREGIGRNPIQAQAGHGLGGSPKRKLCRTNGDEKIQEVKKEMFGRRRLTETTHTLVQHLRR